MKRTRLRQWLDIDSVAPNRSFFDEVVLPAAGAMSGAGIQVSPTLTYDNMYGTSLRGGYNTGTGQLEGSATFPIGAAENGNLLTVEGGYGPQGPSAFIGFKKKNGSQDQRRRQIQQSEDAYSVGLDLFGGGMQRAAGDALGIPPAAMGGMTGMMAPGGI